MRVINNDHIRKSLRGLCRLFIESSIRKLSDETLRASTIVFAPHQDDETLGCGGVIIKKRKTGADVKVVFLTDGGKSHPHLISEDELKTIRRKEALDACRKMNIESHDVIFLDFRDGGLTQDQGAVVSRIAAILDEYRPEEIFVPYYRDPDPSADHTAAQKIVTAAVKRSAAKPIVNEYPVWFWWHWPWVKLKIRRRREGLKVFKEGLGCCASLLRDFRHGVFIGDVLELKETALNMHQSQMRRRDEDPRWYTLGGFSNGEFLACFFQNVEIFRRYHPTD